MVGTYPFAYQTYLYCIHLKFYKVHELSVLNNWLFCYQESFNNSFVKVFLFQNGVLFVHLANYVSQEVCINIVF